MSNSLSAGLAGLRAHQQYIDVVGNNIANANTPGYRGQRALFSELLAATIRPAGGPGANVGGTNPMQVGLGVRIGSIATDTGQGGLISTGRSLDLALEGAGFFVLSDGVQRYFTRIGSFGFDSNQDLVDTRTGLRVLSPGSQPIRIDATQTLPAKPTTKVTFQGNLPAKVTGPKAQVLTTAGAFLDTSDAPAVGTTDLSDLKDNSVDYVDGDTITITGTDSDGSAISATFTYGAGNDGTTVDDLVTFINSQFTGATVSLETDGNLKFTSNTPGPSSIGLQIKNDPKTSWATHAFSTTTTGTGPDKVDTSIEIFDAAGISHNVTLQFERQTDGSWNLNASMPEDDGTVDVADITNIQFGADGTFSGVFGATTELQFSFTGQPGVQSVAIQLGTPGSTSGVTQYGDEATAQAKAQDGFGAGVLTTMSFNGAGKLIGFFSNGVQQELAQIAVATFANQEGLTRQGETMYTETANSGVAILGSAQSGSAGVVRAGSLESSNVDIAREFVNLIEAQRGFQANARVISATDQLLAELVNIIR